MNKKEVLNLTEELAVKTVVDRIDELEKVETLSKDLPKFAIRVEKEISQSFRAACTDCGTNATNVLKEFMKKYVELVKLHQE